MRYLSGPRGRAIATAVAVTGVSLVVGLGVTKPRLAVLSAVLVPAALGALLLALSLKVFWPSREGAADVRRLARWTGGVFVAHIGIGFVIASSSTLTSYLGADAVGYHLDTAELARVWDGLREPFSFPAGKAGFSYMLAPFYWAFGPLVLTGLILNAALSAALIPIVSDTTKRLFGSAAARKVAPLLALLPGFMIWTSQLLREAPILFLLAVAVNASVRLVDRTRPIPLVVLAMSVGFLLSFRANVALVFALGMTAAMIGARRNAVASIGATGVVVAALAFVVFGMGVGESGLEFAADADLADIQNRRADSSRSAASGFAPDADVSTTEGIAAFLPVGMVNFAFGPFPWQVGSARQALGLLEAATLWALVPSFWRGWVHGRELAGRRLLLLLIPAVGVLAALAVLIANFGTVVRERLQVLVIVLPIAALGLALRDANRRLVRERDAGQVRQTAPRGRPRGAGTARRRPRHPVAVGGEPGPQAS